MSSIRLSSSKAWFTDGVEDENEAFGALSDKADILVGEYERLCELAEEMHQRACAIQRGKPRSKPRKKK